MNQMLLGLDFGTCYSSAALNINNTPKPIKEPIKKGYSFPSSVFITPQEEILIGQAAENSRQKDPQRYRREFKRDLGSPNPYTVGNTARLPEELATEVIRKLKTEAEKMAQGLGDHLITEAVLTIPATYQPFKRQLMEQAGLQAGFNQIKLLEEPVAAAYYYSRQAEVKEGEIVLVYDLGGGTFDATLIQKQGLGYQILGMPRGLSHCGGADFDREIYQGLRTKCSPQLQEKLSARDAWLARSIVTESCRDLKHQLSEQQEATIYIPLDLDVVEPYTLSRLEFNRMISPLVLETVECCDQLVRSAGVDWQQIDRILLVGGSCRIPYIQQTIEQKFQRSALLVDEPELAVCLGAAIEGLKPIEAERVVFSTRAAKSSEKKVENPLDKFNPLYKFNKVESAELSYASALQFLKTQGGMLSSGPCYSLAVKYLSDAIKLNPEYAEAFYTRGETRARMGDKPGAETDLYQAAQIYFSRQDFVKYQEAMDKIQAIHSSLIDTNEAESDRQEDVPTNSENSSSIENALSIIEQHLITKDFTWNSEKAKADYADIPVEAVANGNRWLITSSFAIYFTFGDFTNSDLNAYRDFAKASVSYCKELRKQTELLMWKGIVCYPVALITEDSSLKSAIFEETPRCTDILGKPNFIFPVAFAVDSLTFYNTEANPYENLLALPGIALWRAIRQNLAEILS